MNKANSQFRIRPAEKVDIDDIAYVSSTTFRETFGPHATSKTIERSIRDSRSIEYFTKTFETHTTLVATIDEKIVGYIQFGPVSYSSDIFSDFSPNDVMIEQLYVLSGYQGQGIGNELLNHVLEMVVPRENQKIFLDVWPRNEHAVRLYERHGFIKVGELPYHDEGKIAGYDDIMARTLDQ